MRAPNVRVVLAGLAAAAVFAGGTFVTRNGPLGARGGAAADAGATTTAGGRDGTAPTTSLVALGTMSDRLARLPPVAPGELAGVLDVGGNGCSQLTIDLGTLARSGTPRDLCAAPGARFGIPLRDVRRDPQQLDVVDLDGRPSETIAVPEGWDWWGVARQGVVFCKGGVGGQGRIRRFGGATARLPSCPLTQARDGLVFAGADQKSVIDEHGRRLAALARPLPQFPDVRALGDGLLAVDTDLYRDGRRIASFGQPDLTVLGASRDGKVVLLSDATGRMFVYRDGVRHEIDGALGTQGGVVAPDGRRLVLQRDNRTLLELDAATLRPLARLELGTRGQLLDWRPVADA